MKGTLSIFNIFLVLLFCSVLVLSCSKDETPITTNIGSEIAVERASMQLYNDTKTSGYRLIYAIETQKRIEEGEKLFIIDTRSTKEYNKKHISNAFNFPAPLDVDNAAAERQYSEILQKNAPEDLLTPIIIYADSVKDRRSHLACVIFIRLGYRYVYRMPGGFTTWLELGLPISK